MAERTIIHRTVIIAVVLLCLLLFGWKPALANPPLTGPQAEGYADSRQDSRNRILSVLETRTADEKILAKAAEKLQVLDGRELRLMASLSDRVAADEGSPGAAIAYSLITALIVLS